MSVTILQGDCRTVLATLPADSVDCVVTSPPYWGLRDYGTGRWEGGDPHCDHRSPTMRDGRNEDRLLLAGSVATNTDQLIRAHNVACGKCGARKVDQQIGLETSLGEHMDVLVDVFREVRRVLKPTGTVWLNYGDSYACAPNGRSAAATKASGTDDRTFRDKPISTVGPIDRGKRSASRWGGGNNPATGTLKPKDRMLLPARLAIALQEDGWWVRDEIIWAKPNPMPSSVKDRTTPAHEMIYMLSKAERYFYDHAAIKEPLVASSIERLSQDLEHQAGSSRANGGVRADRPMKAVRFGGNKGGGDHGSSARLKSGNEWKPSDDMRAKRSVWTVPPKGFKEAHFATFPPDLIRPCILAGCPVGGVVLDPFFGAGTVGMVAQGLGRRCIGVELNVDYIAIAERRLRSLEAALI